MDWIEVLARDDIVGGTCEFEEGRGLFQGRIERITLQPLMVVVGVDLLTIVLGPINALDTWTGRFKFLVSRGSIVINALATQPSETPYFGTIYFLRPLVGNVRIYPKGVNVGE